MATIDALNDAYTLCRARNPVISEVCFHTFQKGGVNGTLYTDLESRLGSLDLRVPQEYECPVCKEMSKIEQIVTNDAWIRLNTLIDRYIKATKPEDQSVDEYESEIEGKNISDVYAWELAQDLQAIQESWQKEHLGEKWKNLKVVDFLNWKEDPLIKKLFEEWKAEHPTEVPNHLYIERLTQLALKARKERQIDVFKDIRPAYLLGYTAETRDEEKIKQFPSRSPAFAPEPWSNYETLKFIVLSIYNFALAILCEIGLYLLYFWECGFLTKEQYTDLRATHVIHRIMPFYLQYMGLPTEKPTN